MSLPLPAVRSMPLAEIPATYPDLRFAVRTADGDLQGHDAGARHPLAGTGKLVLACTVARLARRDTDLLGERLELTGRHREGVRTGTLRMMSGAMRLRVADAMALAVGTGDAMCVLAVLELLHERGIDVVAEARDLVAGLGLQDTEVAGLESAAGGSWGEGLTGWTTPEDLCTLVSHTAGPSGPSESAHGESAGGPAAAWMEAAFEPAGLAAALPGFGPHTVPHRTIAGWELTGRAGAGPGADAASGEGCASVLSLPAAPGGGAAGRGGAVVAAYLPETEVRAPGEASAVLATLGLSVWQDVNA